MPEFSEDLYFDQDSVWEKSWLWVDADNAPLAGSTGYSSGKVFIGRDQCSPAEIVGDLELDEDGSVSFSVNGVGMFRAVYSYDVWLYSDAVNPKHLVAGKIFNSRSVRSP